MDQVRINNDGSGLLSASILGANWLEFGKAVALAEQVGADLLQIDIADGHFTPTITFGEELVRRIRDITNLPIEVHLMVSRPQDWFSMMAERGVDFVIFHVEAVQRLHATIQQARRHEMGVGVALNSETSPDVLKYILPYIDLVTLMAIIPGFAGQPFIPETISKLRYLRDMIDQDKDCQVLIEVDGGVKTQNVLEVMEAGADIVVVSSGIYSADDPRASVKQLRSLMRQSSRFHKKVPTTHNFLTNISLRRKKSSRI